ncbi:crocetin glucosyltransferase, chloroplastic-like [Diospyros lotus]|uniref:crocetin glucosyltransferase, chloroplastic-like n=1 Tax=Diospyros lotus TaxID=55363 RepID=UPI002255AC25|nr:crocetin glucosyltransferase, chloroplastic-like [Diospyros lotus]
MASHLRILLVFFPGQGHINPSLQFAKRLGAMGAHVTLLTAYSALNRMAGSRNPPEGLTFAGFSDGYDDGWQKADDLKLYVAELRRRGSEAVAEVINSAAGEGRPFVHVVYTIFLPWVGLVARSLHVPSTFLWIQPATLLDVYFYYFNGYGDEIRKNSGDPSWCLEIPGLPRLTGGELSSFVQSQDEILLPVLKEHFDVLKSETNPKILVNTFEALEPKTLKAIKNLKMAAVGPLIPSAFLNGKHPSDTSFCGDIFEKSKDYVHWLNSQPKESVVYVSFGSVSVLSEPQMEEIAKGLVKCNRPFLWVVRRNENGEKQEEKLSCKDELEEKGLIVPWCSQLEVLQHESLGCFVSHCGWNSTVESLVSGVPVVAFPQWTDQPTNAKLVEDVWMTGKRVGKNGEGIVESEEIYRCIEMVMGGDEMRRNAKKWKVVAMEAAMEGGSSDFNLKAFLDDVRAAI